AIIRTIYSVLGKVWYAGPVRFMPDVTFLFVLRRALIKRHVQPALKNSESAPARAHRSFHLRARPATTKSKRHGSRSPSQRTRASVVLNSALNDPAARPPPPRDKSTNVKIVCVAT